MRILAVDIGDKRTGLAVGDDETRTSLPLEVIERPFAGPGTGGSLLEAIAEAAASQNAHLIVLGLPLNMDGTDNASTKRVRAFADRIAARTRLPVDFQDERLTTADADWTMAQSGLTHKQKKERRDALAAAAILRDYLESHYPL